MSSRNAFDVSFASSVAGHLVHRYKKLWLRAGDLETRLLNDELSDITIDRPIFIAGLARSGTTILLELISSVPGVTTHKYRDFPPIFTPFAWNWFIERAGTRPSRPVERAHNDRIKITPDSPEAMEEPLWMAFFDNLHDWRQENVLDKQTTNTAFEKFYSEHIRKLLLLRRGSRYASKGNYNVSRMEYLLKLFPGARFIVPVRGPAGHIGSLMKQHRLFEEAIRENPRARAHLCQVGHFEFGPIRSPINTGSTEMIERIQSLWNSGHEAAGWACYWKLIYGFVAEQQRSNSALNDATLIVDFEDLCASPVSVIQEILDHCELAYDPDLIEDFGSRISLPTYYDWPFSDIEQSLIEEETNSIVMQLRHE